MCVYIYIYICVCVCVKARTVENDDYNALENNFKINSVILPFEHQTTNT